MYATSRSPKMPSAAKRRAEKSIDFEQFVKASRRRGKP